MRKLVYLLPWMVLAGAAYGQVRQADILYTHHDQAPTRGFRVGDEVFVPLDDVTKWNWSVTTKAELAFVKAEGVEFMVPTRTFNGKLSLPLVAAIRKAGGQAKWDSATDTLKVFADLSSLRVDGSRIRFYAGFKTEPRITTAENPKRLIIELPGCSIGPKTQQSLTPNAKAVQVKDNLVRITVETDNMPDLLAIKRGPVHGFELEFPVVVKQEPPVVKDPPVKQEPPVKEPPVKEPPVKQDDPPVVDPPVEVNKAVPLITVQLDREHDKGLALSIPLTVPMTGSAQARRPEPEVLEVTLPGLFMNLPEDFKLETESVKEVTRSTDGKGTIVRIVFARPMAAEMWMEGKVIRINAIKPNVSGTLAGKVIVVDPGHGGTDGGAKSGGVQEKDLNLIMGKLIAQKLLEEGATVVMTRKTDVFIALNARAKMAMDNQADFFISSHINSTAKPAAQSGTITFHHKNNEMGKLLAECIHREIVKVNGLPNKGVWSDGRIYDSGFAVLRQTKMPGVLLELGFINHPTDRKRMVTAEFQNSVAAAVVRGIKVFLGDAK